MTTNLSGAVQFKLKIADIPTPELESAMRLVLIQNCIVGIRTRAIFGMIPKPPRTTEPSESENQDLDAITMSVYTCFSDLDETAQQQHVLHLTRHIEQQWNHLYAHRHAHTLLRMAPPPVRHMSKPPGLMFDRYRWEQLLRELAHRLAHPHPEKFVQNGLFQQNTLAMQLFYVDERPTHFELRVDMGPIPQQANTSAVLKAMLSHNHFQGEESGIWWALHPENNHVVMVLDHALSTEETRFEAPRAPELYDLLQETSSQCQAFWKTMLLGQHIY